MLSPASRVRSRKGSLVLALSTAWYPRRETRLGPTLRAIRAMGFGAVEIGVSPARFRLRKARKLLDQLELRVVSVHNVCSERKLDPENQRGDWLASPDPETRRQGVEATLESIENAKALGAAAVVLHMGSLPIEAKWDKQELLYRLIRGGEEVARESGATIEGLLAEREPLAPAHLEAASQSLAELLERSQGIQLGIECRMGWHELPSLDELGVLLARLPDPRLGYWHDAGHAAVQEFLGLAGQHEWLRRHGRRTLGVHLHDVRERVRDHYPPGQGEVDFATLLSLLPREALRVLEINSQFIAEEVVLGKRRIEELGGCD
jgi:sugar phosphate isomerase/epimerase